MMTNYADWQTIEYPGAVAFGIPPNAMHELIDDGATICVTVAESEVLASIFPLRQSTVASPKSLELELREFTKLCVRSQVEVTAESYELASDVDFAGVTCMQAVLTIGSDRLWIVRAYARNGGDEMLLLHWNGPRQLALCFPIPLFTSVVPLFAIETGV